MNAVADRVALPRRSGCCSGCTEQGPCSARRSSPTHLHVSFSPLYSPSTSCCLERRAGTLDLALGCSCSGASRPFACNGKCRRGRARSPPGSGLPNPLPPRDVKPSLGSVSPCPESRQNAPLLVALVALLRMMGTSNGDREFFRRPRKEVGARRESGFPVPARPGPRRMGARRSERRAPVSFRCFEPSIATPICCPSRVCSFSKIGSS